MSTLRTQYLKHPNAPAPNVDCAADGTFRFDNGFGSLGVAFAVRAFCTLIGNATPARLDNSFNVSSIVDNAVGDYTVNFKDPMADADYACVCGLQPFATGGVQYGDQLIAKLHHAIKPVEGSARFWAQYGNTQTTADCYAFHIVVVR